MIPLTIEARGEITLNNLPAFREMLQSALSRINRNLMTDEDFGQAEIDVKTLKSVESAVREAAIKSFDDKLKALVDELTATAEDIRAPRLELEKLIAKRKESVRHEIVDEFLMGFDIELPDARRHFEAALHSELKGKRTLESMRSACRAYQATKQAVIHKSRSLISEFAMWQGSAMVPDARELELKSPELVAAELRRRLEAQTAEKERKRLEAEAAKLRAEQAAQAPPVNAAPIEAAPPVAAVESPPAERGITAAEDWGEFRAACMAAFVPLKTARKRLLHSSNLSKAQGFAAVVNQGFTDWIS